MVTKVWKDLDSKFKIKLFPVTVNKIVWKPTNIVKEGNWNWSESIIWKDFFCKCWVLGVLFLIPVSIILLSPSLFLSAVCLLSTYFPSLWLFFALLCPFSCYLCLFLSLPVSFLSLLFNLLFFCIIFVQKLFSNHNLLLSLILVVTPVFLPKYRGK